MSGDQWTARLSEYLDDTLAADERTALEAHLAQCEACRETVAELQRVVVRARSLEDRPPARDLWSGIAERIGVTPPQGTPVVRGPWRRISVSIPQLAAAALVVAGVGAGTVYFALGGTPDAAPGVGESPVMPAVATGAPGAGAMASYDRAVLDLERILAEGRDQLDTGTVRVIEESLNTINRAIARARAALEADPSDPYLKHHLAQAMRQKLDLLRRAADLAVSS